MTSFDLDSIFSRVPLLLRIQPIVRSFGRQQRYRISSRSSISSSVCVIGGARRGTSRFHGIVRGSVSRRRFAGFRNRRSSGYRAYAEKSAGQGQFCVRVLERSVTSRSKFNVTDSLNIWPVTSICIIDNLKFEKEWEIIVTCLFFLELPIPFVLLLFTISLPCPFLKSEPRSSFPPLFSRVCFLRSLTQKMFYSRYSTASRSITWGPIAPYTT